MRLSLVRAFAHFATFGMRRLPAREAMRRAMREARYPAAGPLLELPAIDPAQVLPDRCTVSVSAAGRSNGNVSLIEETILAMLAASRCPRTVLEIGTFDGRTTRTIAANAPQATVYTLDLPPQQATALDVLPEDRPFIDKRESGALYQGGPEVERIRQLYGDSATFDFSAVGPVDLAFIDGSHAYEYVLSDARRVLPLLRQGRGVLLFHDYGAWDGVTRALNELHADDQRFRGLVHLAGTTLALLDVA